MDLIRFGEWHDVDELSSDVQILLADELLDCNPDMKDCEIRFETTTSDKKA